MGGMVRVWVGLAVVGIVFTIYSLIDCALIDRRRARGVPKGAWILIVILLPVLGGILWFAIGRAPARRLRASGPDDDPEFLRRLGGDEGVDERIRQMEEELRRLDDEGGAPADPGDPGPGGTEPGSGPAGPASPNRTDG